MPNQRKKGKVKVGLWIDEKQEQRLKELAKAHALCVSDIIKFALEEYEANCKNQPHKENT